MRTEEEQERIDRLWRMAAAIAAGENRGDRRADIEDACWERKERKWANHCH